MADIHVFRQQSNVQQQQQHHHRSHGETLDSISSWSDISNSDEPEPNLYAFDFDPLSPPNLSFFMPSASHRHPFNSNSDSESESDHSDSVTDPSSFYGRDQMIFVTDLFESRHDHILDHSDSVSDPFLDSVNNDVYFTVFGGSVDEEPESASNYAEVLDLGLGIGNELDDLVFASESRESSTTRGAESIADDFRVVGCGPDSGSDDVDAHSGVDDDGTDRVGDPDFPIFWNSLRFDDHRAGNEEFEWEEVDVRVDEREGLSSVIDRIEEISVSSETSSEGGGEEDAGHAGDEAVQNFEWEVLLAINSLERNLEFENDGGGYGVSHLAVQDDYVYAAEYDTLFRHFVETESALKGSPPAAKSVVENLPSVVLTKEERQKNNVACAVCKDDILVEEKVTRLPCRHHYHGDCILPWLSIRNTCPVCRYELPTDDVDYEQRKNEQGGLGLLDDLQFRSEKMSLWPFSSVRQIALSTICFTCVARR